MTPTPEALQYLLGIHPSQVVAMTQGRGYGGAAPSDEIPPPDEVPPEARGVDTSTPEEKPAEKRLIAVPPGGGPRIIGMPRVGPPAELANVPSEPKPESAAPSGDLPGKPQGEASLSDLMHSPMSAISGDQDRENKDRAELQRLRDTGSGVSQFQQRHHFLGPLVRGLSIAGSVVAPGVAAQIPGTDLHHSVLEAQQRGRVEQDIEDRQKNTAMANQTETAEARMEAARVKGNAEHKFIAGSEKEDPNSPTGWTAQTFAGEWKPFTPAQDHKTTKAQDFQELLKIRTAEADRMRLDPEDRKHYILNGKLREPSPTTNIHNHIPSAEFQRYQDWKTAFIKQYGREPTADEIREQKFDPNAHSGTKFNVQKELSDAEQQRDSALFRQQQAFKKGWDQAYRDNDGKPDEKTLAGLKKQNDDAIAGITNTYRERVNTLKQSPQGTPRTTPQAGVSNQLKVGQSVMVGGKPHIVTGFNAEGKPTVRPDTEAQQQPGTAAHKVGDVVTVGGKQLKITSIRPDGKYEGDPVE